MATRIGWTAHFHIINLNTGGVFTFERTNKDGPIRPGSVAYFLWDNGERWDGGISGAKVSWKVQPNKVALIPHNTEYTIWIEYPTQDPAKPDKYPWIAGHGERWPNR